MKIRSFNEESLFFIAAANMRDSPHVAPCTFAVGIGLTGFAFGGATVTGSFIAAANMRDSPHVAPGTFAVIVGLASFTFGSFGGDLIATTDVRYSPHVAPRAFAVVIGLTRLAFGGFAGQPRLFTYAFDAAILSPITLTTKGTFPAWPFDLIATADMRDSPHVTPRAFAVIVGLASLTFGGFAGHARLCTFIVRVAKLIRCTFHAIVTIITNFVGLIATADMRDSPHIAPLAFAVVICLTGCSFGGFAEDWECTCCIGRDLVLLIEELHCEYSGL